MKNLLSLVYEPHNNAQLAIFNRLRTLYEDQRKHYYFDWCESTVIMRLPLRYCEIWEQQEFNWFTSAAADTAAKYGRIDALQWLNEQCIFGTDKAVVLAASNGHIETYMWLVQHNPQNNIIAAVTAAIANNHQHFVTHPDISPQLRNMHVDTAAYNGHLQLLMHLLDVCGFEASTTTANIAATGGQLDILQFLQPLDLITEDTVTSAAIRGHLHVVEWCYAHTGARVTSKCIDNTASAGHFDVVRFLINTDTKLYYSYVMELAAAKHGQLTLLIDIAASRMFYYDAHCECVVRNAIIYGHLHILHWCMELDPTIGPSIIYYNRDAALATVHGHRHIVAFFHKHLDFLPSNTHVTNLYNETSQQHFDTLQYLLSAGVKPFRTAIAYATRKGNLDNLKQLHRDFGYLPSTHDCNIAVQTGHLHVVQWMVATLKIFPTVQAFSHAAQLHDDAMLRWLLDECAHVYTHDNSYNSVKSITIGIYTNYSPRCLRLLLQRGVVNKLTNTHLYRAIKNKNLPLLRWLYGQGLQLDNVAKHLITRNEQLMPWMLHVTRTS